jgi:hypothetical protein
VAVPGLGRTVFVAVPALVCNPEKQSKPRSSRASAGTPQELAFRAERRLSVSAFGHSAIHKFITDIVFIHINFIHINMYIV